MNASQTITAKIGSRTYRIAIMDDNASVFLFFVGYRPTTDCVGSARWDGSKLSCFTGNVKRLRKGLTRALLAR